MSNITNELNVLLADHQVLYQKLRNYHWTVRGPMFFGLHAEFEKLYDIVAERADAIAERVMALGGRPLATLAQALGAARLEEDAEPSSAAEMVRRTADDFEVVIRQSRRVAAAAADSGDAGTANLLEAFADADEKTVWMLHAFLGEPAHTS